MLPARNRLTRSTEFGATVKHGVRAVEPDIVIHVRRCPEADQSEPPRIGLVVARSVGTAVQRHRVARRLRHVASSVLKELAPGDRVVIRAMPSSRHTISARLEQQLRSGLRRTKVLSGVQR